MMSKIGLILCVSILGGFLSANAAPDVTANGLFNGKAVLTIGGKQVFISEGETRRGVKLVEADEDHAVIEIGGQRSTLELDKSIAKEYSTPAEFKRHSESKSHIIDAKIIHQTSSLATFEVEYYFAKNLGDRVMLSAKTLSRGEPTEYWSHTYTPLTVGRNLTTVTVGMNEKAPERYVSDQLLFEMNWSKKDKVGTVGAFVFEFIKQWDR